MLKRWRNNTKFRRWTDLLIAIAGTILFIIFASSAWTNERVSFGRGHNRWTFTLDEDPVMFAAIFLLHLLLVVAGFISIYFAIGQLLHGIVPGDE